MKNYYRCIISISDFIPVLSCPALPWCFATTSNRGSHPVDTGVQDLRNHPPPAPWKPLTYPCFFPTSHGRWGTRADTVLLRICVHTLTPSYVHVRTYSAASQGSRVWYLSMLEGATLSGQAGQALANTTTLSRTDAEPMRQVVNSCLLPLDCIGFHSQPVSSNVLNCVVKASVLSRKLQLEQHDTANEPAALELQQKSTSMCFGPATQDTVSSLQEKGGAIP